MGITVPPGIVRSQQCGLVSVFTLLHYLRSHPQYLWSFSMAWLVAYIMAATLHTAGFTVTKFWLRLFDSCFLSSFVVTNASHLVVLWLTLLLWVNQRCGDLLTGLPPVSLPILPLNCLTLRNSQVFHSWKCLFLLSLWVPYCISLIFNILKCFSLFF